MKTSTLYLLLTLLAISALIVGLIIGCDEKQIKSPLLGPSAGAGPVGGGDAQKIRLTANPSETITTLEDAEATVQITAIVENNIGQPMPDGTVVYWTATNGTLDSVTTTTTNGASSVTLTFPKAFTGSSVVTATAGDATDSITINVVSITPTGTPSKGLVVSADQTIIPHQGTTTITAFVSTDGEPDANVQVNFSASGAGILKESAAITDENGNASVILIGNNTTTTDQTATVNATTEDGRSGSVSVIVTGGATPTPAPTATPVPTATVAATATPALELIVSTSKSDLSSGGTSDITALVRLGGNPVGDASVNFHVVTSPAAGVGSLAPTGDVLTDSVTGIAQATFTANNPAVAGVATITITHKGITKTSLINVTP